MPRLKLNAYTTLGVLVALACAFYFTIIRPLMMSREAGVRLLLEHRAWAVHDMLEHLRRDSIGYSGIVADGGNWRVAVCKDQLERLHAIEHRPNAHSHYSMPYAIRLNDGDQLTPFYMVRTAPGGTVDRPNYLTDSLGNPVIAVVPSNLTDWRENPDITFDDLLTHLSNGAMVYLSYADHSFYKLDSSMLSKPMHRQIEAVK